MKPFSGTRWEHQAAEALPAQRVYTVIAGALILVLAFVGIYQGLHSSAAASASVDVREPDTSSTLVIAAPPKKPSTAAPAASATPSPRPSTNTASKPVATTAQPQKTATPPVAATRVNKPSASTSSVTVTAKSSQPKSVSCTSHTTGALLDNVVTIKIRLAGSPELAC